MTNKKGNPEREYFDSEKKRKWIGDNTRTISVKLNNHTDADILAYINSLEVSYASVIKQALRDYMTTHSVHLEFHYGMRLRGYSPGAQPGGVIDRRDDPSGKYHDIIVYDHPLTGKECEEYELDHIYPAE